MMALVYTMNNPERILSQENDKNYSNDSHLTFLFLNSNGKNTLPMVFHFLLSAMNITKYIYVKTDQERKTALRDFKMSEYTLQQEQPRRCSAVGLEWREPSGVWWLQRVHEPGQTQCLGLWPWPLPPHGERVLGFGRCPAASSRVFGICSCCIGTSMDKANVRVCEE